MASLEDTLTRYHDSLVRYRDIQSLELSSWTEANDFAHVVLPYVPKKQKTTVDAGDFVTPAGSGDSFTHVAKFLNLDAFLSRIILRFHGTLFIQSAFPRSVSAYRYGSSFSGRHFNWFFDT